MKTITRLLTLLLVVSLFCSVMSMGASAASGSITSTAFDVKANDNIRYYCKYSDTEYWVGTGYKTGYNGGRKAVGIVQTRMYLGSNYNSNTLSQIDGYYGTDTANAIYYYQSFYPTVLDDPDGIAGVKTLRHCLYTNCSYSINEFAQVLPYTFT